jgi:glycosyltransferase involved in cell wall biosynthesis
MNSLLFDDIIFKIQNCGGISNYWREVTLRVEKTNIFNVSRIDSSKLDRYLPTFSQTAIFHSSFYRLNLYPKVKNVITIHDFIYEFGFLKTLNNIPNILQIRTAINYADAIICVSENTKKDLFSLYPQIINHKKVYVIEHGTSFSIDKHTNTKQFLSMKFFDYCKPQRYILFVGKRLQYKNFQAALLGFYRSSLPKLGFSMICVGTKFLQSEEKIIEKLGLKKKVVFFDDVNEQNLGYLYKHAFALVYPSLYEGFGLPPLEAMSCGCPVIASNTSAIPEVVADSGILINPYDINTIASALEKLLSDEIRNNYIVKGLNRAKLFSWEQTAQKYIEIYKSLITDIE